jgi:hypothetical protein
MVICFILNSFQKIEQIRNMYMHFITYVMSLTSRPREATSVATRILVWPSLKSSKACSRSICSLFTEFNQNKYILLVTCMFSFSLLAKYIKFLSYCSNSQILTKGSFWKPGHSHKTFEYSQGNSQLKYLKSENGRVGNILDLDNILRHKYVQT